MHGCLWARAAPSAAWGGSLVGAHRHAATPPPLLPHHVELLCTPPSRCLFTPTPPHSRLAARAGLLTIVEQIPGLVVWGDATQELERGYFPSYNVPYFEAIYEQSGYKAELALRRPNGEPLGDLSGIDYQLAPRAQIFRRDAGKVDDLDSFMTIMRYNDFQNDPLAHGSPWNAICSRGDLASSPDSGGCLDGKVGAASLFAAKATYVINGPSTGSLPPGGNLPPFSWSQFPNTPHAGLPETYDFLFEKKTPSWA